ncbi:hypothetical protein SSBR45G_47100 [Bradyrhizobium sp. SSBR45G]|nr:hypothetical protein SSBR45G_47100 [Bradyrhizobium sp. SSBR45G]GLH87080.1 hypothetical protein SSBR45R_45400 [Bradyrhizobium sp. SSBR45R]
MREHNARWISKEEGSAEAALEFDETTAERGLADAKLDGGTVHAPARGDDEEQAKQIPVCAIHKGRGGGGICRHHCLTAQVRRVAQSLCGERRPDRSYCRNPAMQRAGWLRGSCRLCAATAHVQRKTNVAAGLLEFNSLDPGSVEDAFCARLRHENERFALGP